MRSMVEGARADVTASNLSAAPNWLEVERASAPSTTFGGPPPPLHRGGSEAAPQRPSSSGRCTSDTSTTEMIISRNHAPSLFRLTISHP